MAVAVYHSDLSAILVHGSQLLTLTVKYKKVQL